MTPRHPSTLSRALVFWYRDTLALSPDILTCHHHHHYYHHYHHNHDPCLVPHVVSVHHPQGRGVDGPPVTLGRVARVLNSHKALLRQSGVNTSVKNHRNGKRHLWTRPRLPRTSIMPGLKPPLPTCICLSVSMSTLTITCCPMRNLVALVSGYL